MKTIYFKQIPGSPAPLTAQIKRAVRFDELDPLAIMWHGNYASFFEEARVALGDKYGIGYTDFAANDAIIPLRKFYADYFAPLEFGKVYTIRSLLHFNPAARLDFEFEIFDAAGRLMTTGCSVHMMLERRTNNIMVAKPDFFETFCQKWRRGEVK